MAMTRELLRTKDQRDCQKRFVRAAVGDVNSQVRHKSHSVLCSISVCAPERIRGPRQLAARPCRLGAAQGCAVMRLLQDESPRDAGGPAKDYCRTENLEPGPQVLERRIVSSNGQLQCANDELEPSKEELQLLNQNPSANSHSNGAFPRQGNPLGRQARVLAPCSALSHRGWSDPCRNRGHRCD